MRNKIEFSDVLSAVQKIHREYKERPIETKVAPEDDMVNADWDHQKTHYFAVGANAVEIILQSMTLCAVTSLASILDMPSGFGRVTRHLRAAFPEASLYASDLYRDRIDFCAQVLGTKAIKSEENLDEIVFPTKFDLIWCGSLLTHFAAPEFESALALFSRSLNVNGIAIVTLTDGIPYLFSTIGGSTCRMKLLLLPNLNFAPRVSAMRTTEDRINSSNKNNMAFHFPHLHTRLSALKAMTASGLRGTQSAIGTIIRTC